MNTSIQAKNLEKISGVVQKITYHDEESGWSVIKVEPLSDPSKLTTVVIHQAKVFPGATLEFWGDWTQHSKYGEQFKATKCLEIKPATTAALEKYLGSGLIVGVGPATAKKIVNHFKDRTLDVFEESINELSAIPGISSKKLVKIKNSWNEHKAIREVMIFLQSYEISTLFSTKIYKTYGDKSIEIVSDNPYRLANDISGIGFFSSDKIALSMGFERKGSFRISAGIMHVLATSRNNGHCFLTKTQILSKVPELLKETLPSENMTEILNSLILENEIKSRILNINETQQECFYSKRLYYDELTTSKIIKSFLLYEKAIDSSKIEKWITEYCSEKGMKLSPEQYQAVCNIPKESFSILTGGPGCGKTTCTKALVLLLLSLKKKITLVAPTGRASQRMSEVIGLEAKTIHRLLEWAPEKNSFKYDEDNKIITDFLIVDETSMLDISLAASMLKAIPEHAQILFIGDPDQLPAVGAGNVLSDLLKSKNVPRFRLTQIFRQAQSSYIIKHAHEINSGSTPKLTSPIQDPSAYENGVDCLFIDSDEATQDQLQFVSKIHSLFKSVDSQSLEHLQNAKNSWEKPTHSTDSKLKPDDSSLPDICDINELLRHSFSIPSQYKHVDLKKLFESKTEVENLLSTLKTVHPWSSLKYGMTAIDTVTHLYLNTIKKWMGDNVEIQILSPQIRGSLGTRNLNHTLQNASNPESPSKKQIIMGEKIFRVGDKVIQTRNNYNLEVFNGDIGRIVDINVSELSVSVQFFGSREKPILFSKEDLNDLMLGYSITIHKSQGSEFDVVIIPILGQHFNMLYKNLIYTGLTRAKKLAIFVGSRKAFNMAIKKTDNKNRQTGLLQLIEESTL